MRSYLPPHFREARPDVLDAFMRRYPLATLVSRAADDDWVVSHVPLVLESAGERRRLHGHFARANTQSHSDEPRKVLAVFHGPQAYVSPSWYPSKRVSGRVVPTWLYVVVHAEGELRIVDDQSFLERHLRALTDEHESRRALPWSVDDAPSDYLDATMTRIVPFEITVNHISGKWKLDQNQPRGNREGVAAGLAEAEDAIMSLLVKRNADRVP